MNRKARRAAHHLEQRAGSAQGRPGGVSAMTSPFDLALQHHRAGRLAEATRMYQAILATEPTHLKTLQNLGAIALGANKAEAAAELFRRALAVNAESAELQCNLAIALYETGRYDEVVSHCRLATGFRSDYVPAHITLGRALWMLGRREEAVTSFQCAILYKPDHPDAHAYLGKLLTQMGRFAEARSCFERALQLAPNDALIHVAFGDLHVEEGDIEGSLACFVRAMEAKPDHLPAHYNFGKALIALGRYDAVTAYYEKFVEIEPKFVDGYNFLARAYNSAGNSAAGLEAVRRGLAIEETRQGKAIFVECLGTLNTFSKELKQLLIRAVSEPWSRPLTLASHCVAIIQSDEIIGACIERAAAAWPARLPAERLFGERGLKAISQDKLLRVYLENSRVIDVKMEKFVVALRSALLESALSSSAHEPDAETLALYCALARQCFVSEYAFSHADEETAQVAGLRDALAGALNAGTPCAALHLIAVAAYMPLGALKGHEGLLARAWPQPVEDLLTQQIREPALERSLRAAIPAITPIRDDVSVAVRDQYEHNPYPRWVASQPVEIASSINTYMRSRFPLADFRHLDVEGPLDLLVAGCGTGQSLVDYCRLAGAKTLAVDLSLTSLSYAKRKIETLGLSNIELAQADILELGSLDRKFDVINCGGVLHHLGNPIAGWRVLLSLLRPNGFMSVALYSEIARAEYVQGQKLIAERGYGSSPDDIRRFRRDLILGEDSAMRSAILDCPDFYSISECRDLLFHVQEHRITIPQLKALFEENDLQFLGFETEPHVRLAYAQRFPQDAAQTDLDNWHAFERENPETFRAMYAFWVQKGRSAA